MTDQDLEIALDGDVMYVQALVEEYKAQRADLERAEALLAEARANDRQAMAYLMEIRSIVLGDDFPDTIERVRAMRDELAEFKS